MSFEHFDGRKRRIQTIHIPSQKTDSTDVHTIRNLIVTTKAFSVTSAIASVYTGFLGTESGECTNVLLLCNGALAVRDELMDATTNASSISGHFNVHLGYTTHGVIRENSIIEDDEDMDHEHIAQAGIGHVQLPTSWGKDHGIDWTELWNTAGLHCRPAVSMTQMETLLWHKLGANCVINPLTVLHQCTNGQLPSVVPDFCRLQGTILEEVALVAQQQRLDQVESQGATVNPSDAPTEINDLSPEILRDFCNQVIADTQDNKSSMLQDVLSGKRTEIDYLTGFVVRKGIELGIPTPANADLLQKVQDLSSSPPTTRRNPS